MTRVQVGERDTRVEWSLNDLSLTCKRGGLRSFSWRV